MASQAEDIAQSFVKLTVVELCGFASIVVRFSLIDFGYSRFAGILASVSQRIANVFSDRYTP